MRNAEILAAYDRDIRSKPFSDDPSIRFEWDGPVFRFTGPKPETYWNGVGFAALDEASAPDALTRQIEHFAALGHGFEWKHYAHDTPASLESHLALAGFVAGAQESFIALDLAAAAPPEIKPKGVILRDLTRPEELGALAPLFDAVYGPGGATLDLIAELKRDLTETPERLSVHGAYADDVLVSVGWLRLHPPSPFASLWGGATHPDWRGQGLYKALVSRRCALARQRDARFVTVDASPFSRPILEARGFQTLSIITPWIWHPMPEGE